MTRVHGVPAVQFGDGAEVYKPVHLDGLVEVTWFVRRHPTADFGDLFQLGDPLRVALFGRQGFSQFGVPFGENDHRVTGNCHRGEFFEAVGRLGVIEVVQRIDFRSDLSLVIQHSLVIDLAIQRRVAGRALLHELGKQTCFVGG